MREETVPMRRGEGKRHFFCLPEFAGFPHPAAPWLPTRRAQVCVVCHLHAEGAVRGWYTPAEKLDLNTQDEA
ncbi:hypothetical protein VZT92_017989 [Zoarces viviparus]|uniref:Uncharacterized protein n=1 Tax=Zoarces viviparus TaxID=48416 RepID=A0AAW1EPL1_ZOAVI